MSEITTVGIDLAKHVFSLHGVDSAGRVTLRKTRVSPMLPRSNSAATISSAHANGGWNTCRFFRGSSSPGLEM